MIPEKILQFIKELIVMDTDEAVLELFYKEEPETLGVNAGDWMDEPVSDFIDNWCKENNIQVVYEAEVDGDMFLSQGYVTLPNTLT